jgi:hypothetical protein
VGGLAAEVTEKEFGDYFSKFGIVKDAVVMVDRNTGSSRGFGYVILHFLVQCRFCLTSFGAAPLSMCCLLDRLLQVANKWFFTPSPFFSCSACMVRFVTFEKEETVDVVMKTEHEIMGKYVETKRAEPRDSRYVLCTVVLLCFLVLCNGHGQQIMLANFWFFFCDPYPVLRSGELSAGLTMAVGCMATAVAAACTAAAGVDMAKEWCMAMPVAGAAREWCMGAEEVAGAAAVAVGVVLAAAAAEVVEGGRWTATAAARAAEGVTGVTSTG